MNKSELVRDFLGLGNQRLAIFLEDYMKFIGLEAILSSCFFFFGFEEERVHVGFVQEPVTDHDFNAVLGHTSSPLCCTGESVLSKADHLHPRRLRCRC